MSTYLNLLKANYSRVCVHSINIEYNPVYDNNEAIIRIDPGQLILSQSFHGLLRL